ncbi:AsnC family transcriptional regulator [Wenjunlia vitaminophila]|uniref:AsnC family transcriptional regulator n=1 Tax=Wenjunlia vitaminophila TaxID=76728 RepID=A0A0T6LR30_WENVI|nr:AsnC family transcriptional regulator [Wenjunlia vitaminophila]KRV48574.1 AsnC family transcriptional regulator [Wenjunlia vitaminophila]
MQDSGSAHTADSVVSLDGLDRRIVGALQVDGRAETSRIATVLGVSARTVARRLTRMRDARVLTVVRTVVAEQSVGATLLRVRVLRGRLRAIADSFARRPDVGSVDIVVGGEEIDVLVTAGPADRDRLLFHQLPATGAITSTTAHSVLHTFADAADWRTDALTPGEAAALAPRSQNTTAHTPDRLDLRLLDLLAEDARLPHTALAQRTGASESTVRRRLRHLSEGGMLRTHVTINPRLLGLAIDANLWLEVPPAHLHGAGQALAAHPYTHAVAATTGPANLVAALYCPDLQALYDFTANVLGPLGIARAETNVIAETVKRVGARQ